MLIMTISALTDCGYSNTENLHKLCAKQKLLQNQTVKVNLLAISA
jgi:hypothetical protein